MSFEIMDEEVSNKKKKADKPDYRQMAEDFILSSSEKGVYYKYFQGQILKYSEGVYKVENEFNFELRKWFKEVGYPASNRAVSEITPEVKRMNYMENIDRLPVWHPRKNGHQGVENIISFKNGLFDVSTGKIAPHDRHWVSFSKLDYSYDPSATCPTWLSFLNDSLEGDQKRIDLLQEWFGYCLLSDVSRQVFMVLMGRPGTGKGTVTRALVGLVGQSNHTGFALSDLAERFRMAKLFGKTLAVIGEENINQHRDKNLIVGNLKSITGCDPVLLDWKGNPDMMSITLPVKFNISCNDFPILPDNTGALDRRMLTVPFRKLVCDADIDPLLNDKIAVELSGVANWAIEGLKRLRLQGFSKPEISADIKADIIRDNSPTLAYMMDRLLVHTSLCPGQPPKGVTTTDEPVKVFSRVLQQDFARWSEENGHSLQGSWLSKNLKAVLPGLKFSDNKVTTPLGDRDRVWEGIGLKTES